MLKLAPSAAIQTKYSLDYRYVTFDPGSEAFELLVYPLAACHFLNGHAALLRQLDSSLAALIFSLLAYPHPLQLGAVTRVRSAARCR